MEIRYAAAPTQVKHMDTAELRKTFMVTDMFRPGEINLTYTHHDRIVVGGAMPGNKTLTLGKFDALRSAYFCQNRELAVMNVGEPGTVTCDGTAYELGNKSALYVGRGTKEVTFAGPGAKFYLFSATSHHNHPTTLIHPEEAKPHEIGNAVNSNKGTVRHLIHADGVKSSQIVMGFTTLEPGSNWNTMPAHTHDRRTECYLYTDLPDGARVFHLMGRPHETRHLVMANDEAVISPSWSVHSGVGTGAHTVIWAMAGEHQDYTDVDVIHPAELL